MHLRRTLAATAALLTLALSACATTSAEPGGDRVLDVALQHKPASSLSPYSDDALITTRIGIAETLITLDDQGRAQPGLATSWEMPDDHTLVMTVRDGVVFHDGTTLDGAAVANALTHAYEATSKPRGLGSAELTFTAEGDTVTVTSEQPDPMMPLRFSDPGLVILAPAAYESGGAPSLLGTGTGPFILRELGATEAVAEANPDYWGGDVSTPAVAVQFIEDGGARSTAFRAGDVDVVHGLPIAQLGAFADGQVTEVPVPRGVYLHFNTAAGVFADPAQRAAAARAIDPGLIVDTIYEGRGTDPAGNLFAGGAAWTRSAGSEPSTREAARPAEETIHIATYIERAELTETLSVVAEQLRQAGFIVETHAADYAAMEQDYLDGAYDIVIGSRNNSIGAADPVSFLASDYTCDGTYNLSQYCDPAIDAAVAEASTIADLDARYAAAAEIGAALVADNAVLPLVHEVSLIGHEGVAGLAFDPFERALITHETARES